jgi:hypothetical protein
MHVQKKRGIFPECSFSKKFLPKWPKMGENFPLKKLLIHRVLYLSILVVGNFYKLLKLVFHKGDLESDSVLTLDERIPVGMGSPYK